MRLSTPTHLVLAASLVSSMALLTTGCEDNQTKVQKVVERGLADCKKAEGDFAEIELFEGNDEVLREACDEPLSDLVVLDEFHGKARTGPYEWLVGVDNETGVWVLTQVDWENLDRARRDRAGDEPPTDALQRADGLLAEAQKELPSSAWIRRERVENALELREDMRAKGADPTGLGDAQAVYAEQLAWAKEQQQADLEAELRMMVVGHYRDYKDKLDQAFGSIGGSDEWMVSAIAQAKKDGDTDTATKYQAQLDEEQAERPKVIAELEKKVADITSNLCNEISSLSPNGVEDADLKATIVAIKGSVDCSPAAQQKVAGAEGDAAK